MQISVTFRHLEPDEGVKSYVKEKVRKLEKFLENPQEAHVVLSAEKFRHFAELTILQDGLSVNSKGKDRDLYAAIDQMVEKMDRQIRERRGKTKRKKGNQAPARARGVSRTLSRPESEEGSVPPTVQKTRVPVKPMSLEEALAQLRLSEEDVLFFINSHTGEMNALRRKDGQHEWLEPYVE
ncbi:MAG: ribosome-associated translation inhibitor RaiA [Desulfobacterota bacterium]|nr:ribosome-associated translation inhibitor RaiA [Thermodesulfobacteriota bacterium]